LGQGGVEFGAHFVKGSRGDDFHGCA
jgi:hypothetical protein